MSHPTCGVAHCTRRATTRVENTGTGTVWEMCDWHAATYDRKPMIKRERIT